MMKLCCLLVGLTVIYANPCPLGKVWSNDYEGGVCVCPKPLLSTPSSNDTYGIIDYYWDVVACTFIPICQHDYIWNPLQGRCTCEKTQKCLEGKAFDPVKCECVDRCKSGYVQCIYGTHFDPEKCKCVRNQCAYNVECESGYHFGQDCKCHRNLNHPEDRCQGGYINPLNGRCECPLGRVPELDNSGVKCDGGQCFKCVCGPDRVRHTNPVSNECICNPITCPEPQSQNPLTCECGCVANCTQPHVLNPLECSCSCPNIPCNSETGGVFDVDTCQCICPFGQILDDGSGNCINCPLVAECPPGSHLDGLGLTCGCLINYCDVLIALNLTANCTGNTRLNQVTCDCDPPCNNSCPINYVRNDTTCQCIALCNGMICPPTQILNPIACECQDRCIGVPTNCPAGYVFDYEICQCLRACPGVICPHPYTVDPTSCACSRDCQHGRYHAYDGKDCNEHGGGCVLSDCIDGYVRDPLDDCKCVPSLCPPEHCKGESKPIVECDTSIGQVYNPDTCSCRQVVCTNICPIGTIGPNPALSCSCRPFGAPI